MFKPLEECRLTFLHMSNERTVTKVNARSITRLSIACFCSVVLLSCKGLQDAQKLGSDVAQRFGAASVGVNMSNGSILTLTLTDAAAVKDSSVDRSVVCRHVAEFVREEYSRYADLTRVNVLLSTGRTAGPVTASRVEESCSFTPEQLGPPQS